MKGVVKWDRKRGKESYPRAGRAHSGEYHSHNRDLAEGHSRETNPV